MNPIQGDIIEFQFKTIISVEGRPLSMRDTLGGYPIDVEKKQGKTVIRFLPKSEAAKFPNDAILVLPLDDADAMKLMRIILG